MTLLLTARDVRAVVDRSSTGLTGDMIQRIADAHSEQAGETALQHSRIYLRHDKAGVRRPKGLFSMSAVLTRSGRMGTRLHATSKGDSLLVLFDYHTRRCLSIMDDSIVHGYRTGAVAGLAARYLARGDAQHVAVVGSGSIAAGALPSVCHVLPLIRSASVFSPNADNRERFAQEYNGRFGIDVRASGTVDEAVEDADVIITATNADRPIVPDDRIKAGAYVAVMARNEVHQQTLQRAKTVVASLNALRELDPPLQDPIPSEWVHAELDDLVTGALPGRTHSSEVTILVASAPLATWDVAAASCFFDAAQKFGIGTEVEFSG